MTASLFAAFVLAAPAFAQQNSGFTVQEKPGLALVKPQPWSKNDEATVQEFLAFTDRTVQGTPGAGYYEFKTKQADKRQVPAAKVVKLIVYPDPKSYPTIIQQADRDAIADLVKELKETITQYPSTKTYIDPKVKVLNAEVANFDGGKVKIDGEWKTRESYVSEQVSNLGKVLRADIARAEPPSSFDLPADPRFIALQQMANTSPSANALVTELSETHGKLVRVESRKALLAQLNNQQISLAEAEGAVARLKTLNADEDPKSDAFLKKWTAAVATVKEANAKAAPLVTELEQAMSSVEKQDATPEIPAELQAKIDDLNTQIRIFEASNPPPVLLVESRTPVAVCKVSEGFKSAGPLFTDKRFLEAKDILDPLRNKAESIGPNTVKVIAGLQTYAAGKIEQFTKQREEANLLLSSGKQQEALGKFEEAFATMPDAKVGEQIAQIKQTLPPQ